MPPRDSLTDCTKDATAVDDFVQELQHLDDAVVRPLLQIHQLIAGADVEPAACAAQGRLRGHWHDPDLLNPNKGDMKG